MFGLTMIRSSCLRNSSVRELPLVDGAGSVVVVCVTVVVVSMYAVEVSWTVVSGDVLVE